MTTPHAGMDALVRRISAGELRGTDAFDAIVGKIAERETPAGASPALRQQIHDEAVLAVSQDRALCRLVFADAPAAPAPVAEAPPRQRSSQPSRASATAPSAKEPRRRVAAAPRSRATPDADDDRIPPPPLTDAEIDAELEAIDREREEGRLGGGVPEFGASQRRGQWMGALALGGIVVAGGVFWFATRSDSCDRLVKRICLEGKTKACQTDAFSKALEAQKVDAPKCDAAMTDLDAAVKGVSDTEAPHAFDRALVASLGFDPRGDEAPTPPAVKPKGPPPPTPVVEGQTGMNSLFLDQAHLYWTSSQPPGVFRVRNIGGAIETFGTQPGASDVTPTKNFVYWLAGGATPGPSSVWADKVRGTHSPSAVPLEGFSPKRAAFLGDEFAFIDGVTGAVLIAPVAGGVPRELVPGKAAPDAGATKGKKAAAEPPPPPAVMPSEIIGDETTVFVGTGAPVSTVWAVPRDGTSPSRALATGQTTPRYLRSDTTHVFWLEAASGNIVRVAKAGGAPEVLAAGRRGAGAITLDADAVYWPNAATGVVLRVAKTGGEPTVVAQGLSAPRLVAADSVAVFWEAGGTVYRQAR